MRETGKHRPPSGPPTAHGAVYGHLTALCRVEGKLWRFACQCGAEVTRNQQTVRESPLASCGCQAHAVLSAAKTRHGLNKRTAAPHPAYRTWKNMVQRCTNPANENWGRYGGRGIEVCPAWRDAAVFLDDMLPTWESGLEIERVDNSGNYERSNCRWASRREQANNRRNTVFARLDEVSAPLSYVADALGVRYDTLQKRVYAEHRPKVHGRNQTGHTNVYFAGKGMFYVNVRRAGKKHYRGGIPTLNEAVRVRDQLLIELKGNAP